MAPDQSALLGRLTYMDGVNDNLGQYVKLEHYRLHCAELWPDSPHKEAVLAAVHSALESLEAAVEPCAPRACMVCAARKTQARVLMFPSRSKGSSAVLKRAA